MEIEQIENISLCIQLVRAYAGHEEPDLILSCCVTPMRLPVEVAGEGGGDRWRYFNIKVNE